MCMYLPAKRRQSFPLFLSAIFEGVRSPFLFPPDFSCKVLAEVSDQGLEREICNHTLVLSLADNALHPVERKRGTQHPVGGGKVRCPLLKEACCPLYEFGLVWPRGGGAGEELVGTAAR